MMTLGMPLYHGMVEHKPHLPEGWTWEERADSWLIAVDPEGARYYVSRPTFYPQRKTATGVLFVDTAHPVML